MIYSDIPGWFDFEPLYDAAIDRLSDGAVIAEIGCWLGKSLSYLAQRVKDSGKKITLYGIDPGFGSTGIDKSIHDPVLGECGGNTTTKLLCNLRDCGVLDYVNVLATPSVRAANLFPCDHFDFVFIDAEHTKEAVIADISAWLPVVKPRGKLAGHDYDRHWPSVVDAVNGFFGRECPDPICPHCWSVTVE